MVLDYTGEDPDDQNIREAHGFTPEDDWEDESLLCRNGCGLSYPYIAIGKVRRCRAVGINRKIGKVYLLPAKPACGARAVFWPDDEACDAECVLDRDPKHARHEDEILGGWTDEELITSYPHDHPV